MTWIPLSAFKINALAAYLHLSGAPHYDFVLHRVKGKRLELSKSLRRQPIDEEQAQSDNPRDIIHSTTLCILIRTNPLRLLAEVVLATSQSFAGIASFDEKGRHHTSSVKSFVASCFVKIGHTRLFSVTNSKRVLEAFNT